MTRQLNIGLIGSGFMGQAHADAFTRAKLLYRDLPAVPHLYMLADATPELAANAAARFGFEKSTGDWREMVRDPMVDVVDITSPNNMHFEMAMAAIEAGKHVYCEKPLAVTLAEAEKMAAAAHAKGVKTMVAFNNVKTPAAMLAKQLIERGDIGTPTRFRGWFDQGFFNDPELPFSWRCTRKEAGSGALGDLGSHVISVAQYLMPLHSLLDEPEQSETARTLLEALNLMKDELGSFQALRYELEEVATRLRQQEERSAATFLMIKDIHRLFMTQVR